MCSIIKKIVSIALASILALSFCRVYAAASSLRPHADPEFDLDSESFSLGARECDGGGLTFPDLTSGLSDSDGGDCGSDSEVVVHKELTSLDAVLQPTGMYASLSWWFKVLDSAREIARSGGSVCYENIVSQSLTKNGYCLSTGGLPTDEAELFGIVDFISAFDAKLDEFENFMKDPEFGYFIKLATSADRELFLEYARNKHAFGCFGQRQLTSVDDNYELIDIGDLHGDLISLLTILKNYEANINDDFTFKKKDFYIVCTGDYIDRCQFGLEVLFVLMTLKIKNPENVFLLLGNHEADHVFLSTQNQGFMQEIERKMPARVEGPSVMQKCIDFMERLQVKLFKYLPSALCVPTEFNHILFCHALPNHNQDFLQNFLNFPQPLYFYDETARSSLMFSDMDGYSSPSTVNKELLREPQTVQDLWNFMQKNKTCLLVRGHQHNETIKQTDISVNPLCGMIARTMGSHLPIITVSSIDFNCFDKTVSGLGKPCHFCSLTKNNQTLTIDGHAVDRLSGNVQPVATPIQIQKQVEIVDVTKIDAVCSCLLDDPAGLQFLGEMGFEHIYEDVASMLDYYMDNRLVFEGQYIPCFDNFDQNIEKVKTVLSEVFILDITGIDDYLEALGLVKVLPGGYFKAPEFFEKVEVEDVLSFFEDRKFGIPGQIKKFEDLRRQLSCKFASYITAMRTEDYSTSGIPDILSQMNSIRDRLRFLLTGLGETLELSREDAAIKVAGLVGRKEQAI